MVAVPPLIVTTAILPSMKTSPVSTISPLITALSLKSVLPLLVLTKTSFQFPLITAVLLEVFITSILAVVSTNPSKSK